MLALAIGLCLSILVMLVSRCLYFMEPEWQPMASVEVMEHQGNQQHCKQMQSNTDVRPIFIFLRNYRLHNVPVFDIQMGSTVIFNWPGKGQLPQCHLYNVIKTKTQSRLLVLTHVLQKALQETLGEEHFPVSKNVGFWNKMREKVKDDFWKCTSKLHSQKYGGCIYATVTVQYDFLALFCFVFVTASFSHVPFDKFPLMYPLFFLIRQVERLALFLMSVTAVFLKAFFSFVKLKFNLVEIH